MSLPLVHAAKLIVDLDTLDQRVGAIADGVDELIGILQRNEEHRQAHVMALESIDSCRRRFLSAASALDRLERAIQAPVDQEQR
jgi:hypothetical protein